MPLLRPGVLALGLGLVAAPALAQPAHYARLLRDDAADFFHVPLGLCEDYPEETTTAAIYNADFDLLDRAGIDLLRISFGWDGIEATEDTYDWLFWDDYVRTAVDEHGITLIPYIMYTPQWASRNKDNNFYWRTPPEDFAEFGEFVFDLVTRYKDRIHSWELWNEPDIEWYWTGTPEEFARYVKIGADAVRRADPDATVILGGIAYQPDFIRTLFKDHGVSPYVDVVNMHNYYETWHHGPVENIGEYIRRVDEVVERYGDGQPLWMAEVGYSTVREGARVSDDYTAYYAYEHTPAYQAVQLVKTVTAAFATDRLSALAWYEIKDLPPADAVIGDNNNRNLGVAHADHTAKPAEHALAFINRLYAEPMRSIDDEVAFARAAESDVVVHTFEQEDGDLLVVGWLQTRRVGEQNDVGDGMHADTRREAVEVTIPRATAGTATFYNELGEQMAYPNHRHEGETTTVWGEMEGGKVYIIHVAKD
jgi:hypothetical protein